MSEKELWKENMNLYAQKVPDISVASIRFRGHREDLWGLLDLLLQQVRSPVKGPPLCLRHGGDPQDGFDMEICVPISPGEESGAQRIRRLEGGWMICARHTGPYGAPGDENSLSGSWKKFYAAIAERGIGLAEGPPREVYLEGRLEHGPEAEKYVTELQEYLLLPRWLDRMARSLDRLSGEQVRRAVMSGCESLTPFSCAEEKVRWVKEAIERLDQAVAEEVRREVMADCAHVFPQERIAQLRAEYERLGNIDQVLEIMRQDRSLGESSYYSAPRREGHIIYTTKAPQHPKGFQEATDEVERRAHYCHCPMIKAAIRAQETISPTFCYCGSGWFRRLWSGILGQPVRVEVLQTVLQGDEGCTFAIHLPEEVIDAG